jgi:sterol desaturase/sphingolipid hydroxylase (fatty acid hydroxylase superfamily)
MTPGALSFLTSLYFGLFAGGIVFAWLCEDGAPLRPFANARARRRHALRNFGVLLAVFLFADLLVGTWLLGTGRHLLDAPSGIAARLALPLVAQVLLAIVVIDLYEYGFHRLAHAWRPLWLLHAVHHSDPHVDVTTAMRHHPLETAIVFTGRLGVYVGLGLPLWIEVVRVIVVNSALLAQHANVAFPRALEALRVVVVTPALHRQHHSPVLPSIDRNFGQIFSIWDRLFGSYAAAHDDAPPEYGLRKLAAERYQTLAGVLLTPLRARGLATPL